MISKEYAQEFALDWIDSWNSHDLDRIMSHYDNQIEYYSIFVSKLTGDSSGKISGKNNVKTYLQKGLEAYPELNFKLENIYLGVASITIQYISVNNLKAAEVFELNEQGLAKRVQCHYSEI